MTAGDKNRPVILDTDYSVFFPKRGVAKSRVPLLNIPPSGGNGIDTESLRFLLLDKNDLILYLVNNDMTFYVLKLTKRIANRLESFEKMAVFTVASNEEIEGADGRLLLLKTIVTDR